MANELRTTNDVIEDRNNWVARYQRLRGTLTKAKDQAEATGVAALTFGAGVGGAALSGVFRGMGHPKLGSTDVDTDLLGGAGLGLLGIAMTAAGVHPAVAQPLIGAGIGMSAPAISRWSEVRTANWNASR